MKTAQTDTVNTANVGRVPTIEPPGTLLGLWGKLEKNIAGEPASLPFQRPSVGQAAAGGRAAVQRRWACSD
jgi:hypothetical protein